jgi:hypothetical protein
MKQDVSPVAADGTHSVSLLQDCLATVTYTTAVKITLGAVAHEELESIFGFCQKMLITIIVTNKSMNRMNVGTDASCRRMAATNRK